MKPRTDYFTLAVAIGLFLVLALARALSATYYVDVTSGSNTNAGTATNTAWAALPGTVGVTGTGWQVITNGDTVYVKGGTTNACRVEFNRTWYGGAAAWNAILVQSGHLRSPVWGTTDRAIIDAGTNTAGVAITGSLANGPLQGLTLDGFEVRNVAAGAAGPGYDDSTGSSCILAGSANYPANWLTIKRCYLHNAARTVDNTGHGIEFAGNATNFIVAQNVVGPSIGTKGVETYRASFGVVSNNVFQGTGDHSLALSNSTNVDAGGNLIVMVPPQVHEPAYGIQIATCSKCDVWNNVIYRQTPFPLTAGYYWAMGIGCYAGGVSNRVVQNTVAFFGNPVSGNGSSAIRLLDASGTDTGFVFENNLVYGCYNVEQASYTVWTNYAGGESVRFNDFYGFAPYTNVMSYQGTSGGTSFPAPVASFGLNRLAGRTYTNNQQVLPGITGGGYPDGLLSSGAPNTDFFSLSSTTPDVVGHTGNPLSGDAVRGFNHATNKFGTDIAGSGRTLWSMGAYESVALPAAPPGLVAVATNGAVSLTWGVASGGSPGVSGYYVYQGTTSGGETFLAATNVTSFVSGSLTNGVTYWFQVGATNTLGEGPRSQEQSATPSAPAVPGAPLSLAATAGSTFVTLNWVVPVSNGGSAITNYSVLRGTSSGAETHLAYAGTTPTYTDSAVVAGTRYWYTVKAVNAQGASAASGEVSGVPTVAVIKAAGKTKLGGKGRFQ